MCIYFLKANLFDLFFNTYICDFFYYTEIANV